MEENYYKTFLGARHQTIERFGKLYPEEYFEKEGSEKKKQRDAMYVQEMERIAKQVDLKKGGRVLDIGGGRGDFLMMFGNNWEKYNIDISEFALQEAQKRGIITKFTLQDNFFDVILFRGTVQHVPDAISRIEECYYWLKPGGSIIFLVTPNANSLYYKFFNTLPLLSPTRNFFIPSDIVLKQILENFGFTVTNIVYPYLGTPYAKPMQDLLNFFLKLFYIKKDVKFAFYKNIMEVYAQKP